MTIIKHYKCQENSNTDTLRVSKKYQKCWYEMGISTFSGFQKFGYVGEIWIYNYSEHSTGNVISLKEYFE